MAAFSLGDLLIGLRFEANEFFKGIDQSSQKLQQLSAGITTVGIGLTAGLTVPLAALAAVSVSSFTKFDAAMTQSLAIMGDVSTVMRKDMADAARQMAKETTFNAEQAANSYFFLASAGLSAEASIAALPPVAKFAQAGMFDMARATDLLTDAQSALGLTIRDDAVANMENMIRVSDALVKANVLANASVEQFSEALTNRAGASLRAVNKDVEEGLAVLAAFADQGIKGAEAGTQLGIVLRDLQTKAVTNKEEFKALGLSVFDSDKKMRNMGDIVSNLETLLGPMADETRRATLMQLGFSDRSVAATQALLGTSEAIKGYETQLRSAAGITEEVAAKQLLSFEAQLSLLGSRLMDTAISIGSSLVPMLQKLIQILEPVLVLIEKTADTFTKLPAGIQLSVVAFAGLVAAIGPVLLIVGQLISAVTTIGPAFSIVSTYFTGFAGSAGVAATAAKGLSAAVASTNITLGGAGLAGTVTGLTKTLPPLGATVAQLGFPFAALGNSVGQLSLGLSGSIPAVTSFAGAVPAATAATAGATGAVTGLAAALPWLAAAVGVAIAAFALFQLDSVQEALGRVKEAVVQVWDTFVAATAPLVIFGKSFVDMGVQIAGAGLEVLLFLITENTVKTIEAIATAVKWFVLIGEAVVTSAAGFEPFQVVVGKVVEILRLLGEIAMTVVAVAIVEVNKHLDSLRDAADQAKQFLVSLVSIALEPLGISAEQVAATLDNFVQLMVYGAGLILGSWANALDKVIGFLSRLLSSLQSIPGVEGVLGDMSKSFTKLAEEVTISAEALAAMEKAANAAGPSLEELWTSTAEPLSDFETAVRAAITQLEEQAEQNAINEEALRRYEAAINKGKAANVIFEKDVAAAVKQLVEQERAQKVAAAAAQDYAAKMDEATVSLKNFNLDQTLAGIQEFHKLISNNSVVKAFSESLEGIGFVALLARVKAFHEALKSQPLLAYNRALDTVAKGADEAFKIFNRLESPVTENARVAAELTTAYEKLGVKTDALAQKELADLEKALNAVRRATEEGKASPEELARATEAYNDAVAKATGKTSSWGEALKQISTIINDFAKNFSEKIVDVLTGGSRGEFNAKLEEQMNALRTNLADATSELETSLADRATAYEEYVDDVKKAEQEIIKGSAEKLSEELGKLRKSLADRQRAYDRYVSDVNKSLRRLTEDYQKNLNEERKAVEEALSDRKRSYDRDVADAKKAHERKLSDLEAALNAELAKGTNANQRRIADIRASIAREEEDYRISLQRRSEDFNEYVDDQNKELAAFEEEQRIRYERSTSDQAEALAERTADHQAFTDEVATQMEEVTAKSQEEEAKKLAALSESLNKQTAEYEAFKVEAAAKYEALKADIEGKLTEMEGKHRTVLGDIGGLFKSLFEEATKAGLRFITEFLVNQLFKALKNDFKGALDAALSAFGGFFKAIGEGVKKLIGLFTGKGGLADAVSGAVPVPGTPNIPGSPSGGGGGGGAGSAVGGALGGWIGLGAAVTDAVSGVIGNFQMSAMNKALDLIVLHTLQIANFLGARGDQGILGVLFRILDVASFGTATKAIEQIRDEIVAAGLSYFNASFDAIKQALWDILSVLSGGIVIANGAAMVADGVKDAAPTVGDEVADAVASAPPLEERLPVRGRAGERTAADEPAIPFKPTERSPRRRTQEEVALFTTPSEGGEQVADDVADAIRSDVRAAFSETGTQRTPAVIDEGQLSDLEKRWEELAEFGRATKEAAAMNAISTAGMSAATIPLLTGIQTNTGLLAEGIAGIGRVIESMNTSLTDGFGLLKDTPVHLGEMLTLTRTNLDTLMSIDTRLNDIQTWRGVLDGLAQMEPPTVNVSVFMDSEEISSKVETRIESNIQKAYA